MFGLVITDPTSLTSRLPPVPQLERRCVALATLDAILSPEWEYRCYSFNRGWDQERGRRMGSFRNGCGDEYFILFFSDVAAALKGFDHEAFDGSSVEGVLDGLPTDFADFRDEPAFSMETTTFCLWNAGSGWHRSDTVAEDVIARDGSADMLALLVGTPADYVAHVRDHFEVIVPESVVARFFALEPLTDELAVSLRSDANLAEIEDLDEIGYPSGA